MNTLKYRKEIVNNIKHEFWGVSTESLIGARA